MSLLLSYNETDVAIPFDCDGLAVVLRQSTENCAHWNVEEYCVEVDGIIWAITK